MISCKDVTQWKRANRQPVHMLLDSGADDHFVPPEFADEITAVPEIDDHKYFDAQGQRVFSQGHRTIPFALLGGPFYVPAVITFRIANVKRVILSLGKLKKAGFGFMLDTDPMTMTFAGRHVKIDLVANSLEVLGVQYPSIEIMKDDCKTPHMAVATMKRHHFLAPVAEEDLGHTSGPEGPGDMAPCWEEDPANHDVVNLQDEDENQPESMVQELPDGMVESSDDEQPEAVRGNAVGFGEIAPDIGPGAPVKVMRDRLKELGGAIYGTRAQLWERLQKFERDFRIAAER
jgi:hypothetical protein